MLAVQAAQAPAQHSGRTSLASDGIAAVAAAAGSAVGAIRRRYAACMPGHVLWLSTAGVPSSSDQAFATLTAVPGSLQYAIAPACIIFEQEICQVSPAEADAMW